MDRISKACRSRNMSRVRGSNTKPEIIVRSLLHRLGYRFRVNRRDLPGKPDIVLAKYQTVAFVHGCFWHRHPGCKRASMPATRRDFWIAKLQKNVERDKRDRRELRRAGWQVIVLWECDIRRDPIGSVMAAVKKFDSAAAAREYPLPSRRDVVRAAETRVRYGLKETGG